MWDIRILYVPVEPVLRFVTAIGSDRVDPEWEIPGDVRDNRRGATQSAVDQIGGPVSGAGFCRGAPGPWQADLGLSERALEAHAAVS